MILKKIVLKLFIVDDFLKKNCDSAIGEMSIEMANIYVFLPAMTSLIKLVSDGLLVV